jgi:hypothetical protein
MSRRDGLSEWTHELSNRMPHLSKPQVVVLALWSYGIALTKSCGRRTVAVLLALLLHTNEDAIEQRLQEWCCDAEDKSGKKRRALDVTTCFVPLLCWIVALWTGTAIALTVDATALGERFVVLTVSVVYRGTGIPVAWTVLAGQKKEAWRGHWLRMLRQLHPAIPPRLDRSGAGRSGPVCVLALSTHLPLGLASFPARQSRRQVPASRSTAMVLAERVGRWYRLALAGAGYGLCYVQVSTGMYPGGLVGSRS